jgi:hypothetical protein
VRVARQLAGLHPERLPVGLPHAQQLTATVPAGRDPGQAIKF